MMSRPLVLLHDASMFFYLNHVCSKVSDTGLSVIHFNNYLPCSQDHGDSDGWQGDGIVETYHFKIES